MVAPLVLSALALPALLGLLWARKRDHHLGLAILKPLNSLLFIAAALLWPARDATFGAWILAGLCIGGVGDVLLLGEARRWVAAGLVAFLLAHLCYLVAVVPHARVAETAPVPAALAALALLALGGVALRAARPKLGGLAPAAVVYFLALSSLTWLALAGFFARPRDPGAELLAAGLTLFFVSDLAVARHRFVEQSFTNKLWGLPCYYAAQHLLAAARAHVG